jgi:hypothetical protein
MVSDSDAAGGADGQGTGRSHDIWSPSFSTMGQSTVWLHAAVAAILNNNGLCVFDIDVSAGPSPTAMPFGARLSGAQEAPTPVQTNACGFASFSFNSSTRELSYTINFSGLSATETLAHIHQAAPGVAGPPIHTLALGSPKIGSAVLTAAQATALTNGELYVNIHSEMFPNGEIRGQIGPDVSWVNVFRRVAPGRGVPPLPLADIPEGLPGGPQVGNADGFLGPLDLDISAVAANRPNVRLRFRQFEPDDDWWIAVDDILVDTVPHAGGNTTVLETEEFNDGFIPGSWDVLSNADELAVWRAMDECVISLLNFNGGMFPDSQDGLQVHHMDTGFAHVFRDTSCTPQVQDELLVTPTLDLSAATAAYLHFKSALVLANATPEVLLSIDGGATFDTANPVFSYLRGAGVYRSLDNGEMYYNEYIFSVPAAAGQARVAFAFHYLNRGAEPLGWAVDDVKVTADQPQTRVAFNRGDTNDDGLINLTDGVRLLNFLFLGGPDTTCKETQDVNNDKTINITDGVAVFNFLFLGGNAPADPGPVTQPRSCGLDPDPPGSDGDLGCQSYSAANC